jgi:two-component system phosphate regulon sensor histidine kinase PhoR
VLLSAGVLLVAAIFSTVWMESYFRGRILHDLDVRANEIGFFIRSSLRSDTGGYTRLQAFAHSGDLRLTLIDAGGRVLFESDLPQEKLSTIENHFQRPEVQEALRAGRGTSTRRSATLSSELLYDARLVTPPFPDSSGFAAAAVLRMSIPLTQVNEAMNDIQTIILVTCAIILLAVAGIAMAVARRSVASIREMARIAEEIRSGDYEKRIPLPSTEEFRTLGLAINNMVDTLKADIAKFRKLERVRSEFLGNVSHELRTPIFAIQGMLETLAGGAVDDPGVNRDFVGRALQNTHRLNALIRDLIEISRIESGEMKMSFRYFDVGGLLRDVAAELEPLARQKDLRLDVRIAPALAAVFGDRDRLKQVMVNLVENALKYTPAGGSVVVDARPEERAVKVSVIDSGIGIPPEHLPRIFERFYRVDRERSREAGGTGLGLAIVKHIVEAHGQTVHVDSTVGRGSTFSFLLKT